MQSAPSGVQLSSKLTANTPASWQLRRQADEDRRRAEDAAWRCAQRDEEERRRQGEQVEVEAQRPRGQRGVGEVRRPGDMERELWQQWQYEEEMRRQRDEAARHESEQKRAEEMRQAERRRIEHARRQQRRDLEQEERRAESERRQLAQMRKTQDEERAWRQEESEWARQRSEEKRQADMERRQRERERDEEEARRELVVANFGSLQSDVVISAARVSADASTMVELETRRGEIFGRLKDLDAAIARCRSHVALPSSPQRTLQMGVYAEAKVAAETVLLDAVPDGSSRSGQAADIRHQRVVSDHASSPRQPGQSSSSQQGSHRDLPKRTTARFDESEFERKVDSALEQVKTMLDGTRGQEYRPDARHSSVNRTIRDDRGGSWSGDDAQFKQSGQFAELLSQSRATLLDIASLCDAHALQLRFASSST